MLRVMSFLALAVAAVPADDVELTSRIVSTHTLVIDQAFGASGSFDARCKLDAELVATASGQRWRLKPEGPGRLSASDAAAASAAAQSGGLYRIRARISDDANAPFVYGSTKMCLLAAADFKHDIFLNIDGAGVLRGIDIRLPASAPATCASSNVAAVSAAGLTFPTRFGLTVAEEAAPIPVVTAGKGIPYPGQKEIGQVEIAAAAAQAAGGQMDPETAALLSEQAKKEAQEAPQGFIQQYWPYLLGGWVIMQVMGKLAPEEPAAAQRGARRAA